MNELEEKKRDIKEYIKDLDTKINTINNQINLANKELNLIDDHLDKNKSKNNNNNDNNKTRLDYRMTNEYSYSGDEYSDDSDEEDDEDNNYYDNIILANMDPNLAKLLGIEVNENDYKTDWKPPSFSGLNNSERILKK